jgi:hypothetical protein
VRHPKSQPSPLAGREPFPLDASRDLLGIVRALYVAEREAKGSPLRLQELIDIGTELAQAIELGRHSPGSMGSRAAHNRAAVAVERLGRLIAHDAGSAWPLINAACKRIVGRR